MWTYDTSMIVSCEHKQKKVKQRGDAARQTVHNFWNSYAAHFSATASGSWKQSNTNTLLLTTKSEIFCDGLEKLKSKTIFMKEWDGREAFFLRKDFHVKESNPWLLTIAKHYCFIVDVRLIFFIFLCHFHQKNLSWNWTLRNKTNVEVYFRADWSEHIDFCRLCISFLVYYISHSAM